MSTFTLNVKTISNQIEQYVVNQDGTFGTLKESVAICNRVTPDRVRLICSGKVMKDTDTFSGTGLKNNDYVFLHILSDKTNIPAPKLGKSFDTESKTVLQKKPENIVVEEKTVSEVKPVLEPVSEDLPEKEETTENVVDEDQQDAATIERILGDPEKLARILRNNPQIATLFSTNADTAQAIMAQMMGGAFADPGFGQNFGMYSTGGFNDSSTMTYAEDASDESYEDSEPVLSRDYSEPPRTFFPEPRRIGPRLSNEQMVEVDQIAAITGAPKQEVIQFYILADHNMENAINMILNN